MVLNKMVDSCYVPGVHRSPCMSFHISFCQIKGFRHIVLLYYSNNQEVFKIKVIVKVQVFVEQIVLHYY